MKSMTVYSAVSVDDHAPISVHELARLCDQQLEWVITLVQEGVLNLEQQGEPDNWVFESHYVGRARQVSRLQRDFDVNLEAAALMTDLMEEIRALRAQLSR
jgi:chaperone modulatory protein CbpM